MGWRFQRRIGNLVRFNLSRSGIGISAGVPGLRTGISARGRPYAWFGLPGTGLAYRAESKGDSEFSGVTGCGLAALIMIVFGLGVGALMLGLLLSGT